LNPPDVGLVEWLIHTYWLRYKITTPLAGHLFNGLALLRLSESVLGKSLSPPVPDSAFLSGPHDDELDGLFRLSDFLLVNDVKWAT
jgi:hypothetical protein